MARKEGMEVNLGQQARQLSLLLFACPHFFIESRTSGIFTLKGLLHLRHQIRTMFPTKLTREKKEKNFKAAFSSSKTAIRFFNSSMTFKRRSISASNCLICQENEFERKEGRKEAKRRGTKRRRIRRPGATQNGRNASEKVKNGAERVKSLSLTAKWRHFH